MKPEPHHAHLTEMRINRWPAIVDALVAVPRSALTSRALQAQRAADREARRLAECYPDPTRRHLVEMRLTREEVRRG